MKNYLSKLPKNLKEILRQASIVSGEIDLPVYLVGGCLRDLILGRKNLDLDLAVCGQGIIFAQRLAHKLKAALTIHPRFGTATLLLANGLKVDIATARKETYLHPGALPVVTPGTLKEDLGRRDFTINALALVLGKNQEIIDPYGGREDLSAGKIRILHALSFIDDPTRILRAIRFQQRFNFKLEAKTLALLKIALDNGLLTKAGAHRLRDELILMLKEVNPYGQIKRLSDLGGLSFLNRKLRFDKSTQKLFKSLKRQIDWFRKNYSTRRPLDVWLIYFTALLQSLSIAQIKTIVQWLGLRKGEQSRVLDYYQKQKKLILALSKKSVTPQMIYTYLEPLSYEAIVLLRAATKNINLKKYLADFLSFYNGMRVGVCGADLGKLGVSPGPEYQNIFAQVLAAKLNGEVSNRPEQLALIKKLVHNK